ncbi:MAG: FAD:protein FMN transferase, partial [Candidatus Omnitrophica bacterium]|nr:FAD:protein FMN transferase [Candidatus Omnitrophota bacterium]
EYNSPSEEEIRRAQAGVGSDKIIFHNKDNVVELSSSGVKLDLGAIAKGYAVDCAVKRLREKGIKSCLINAGGDIYCLGTKFNQPWKIAIQDPRAAGFSGSLEIQDKAVATSGDYRQYFIKDKKRLCHILDPRTAYPADSGIASVTVIAFDCLTADALATAIFVLGKDRGEELAKEFPGVEVRVIEKNSGNG